MQFGNLMNVIYAPESNDDDLRDSRDEPKKRDNRPGKLDPYLLRCVFLYVDMRSLIRKCCIREAKQRGRRRVRSFLRRDCR